MVKGGELLNEEMEGGEGKGESPRAASPCWTVRSWPTPNEKMGLKISTIWSAGEGIHLVLKNGLLIRKKKEEDK